MNADWSLRLIAAIAGFLLKTTLAFGLCAALSRLADSAKLRFVLWSGFVYGAAAYWLYQANLLWVPLRHSAQVVPGASQPVTSSFATWQIPSSWAFPLGLTLRVLGVVYLLALCCFTFNHLRQRRHLKWVLGFTSEPPAAIAETFRAVAREMRAGHSRLLLLSGATSPATFGWLQPIILLPSSCVEENPLDLEDVLRHELQHVHRWDFLWNELAVAARGLLCFHPAVWYAVRRMRVDRELASDFAVVNRSPARGVAYAECLLRFAQSNVVPDHIGWGIDFAASEHHLAVRVHSILAASKPSPNWVRYLRATSGLMLAALFLGVAPSLAILLSFTYPPVSNTAASLPVIETPSGAFASQNRNSRRSGSFASKANRREVVSSETANPQETDRPATGLQPDSPPVTLSWQTNFGPQLRRRGDPAAAGNKGATSQTIALTDTDANGQPAKSGDRKQTVQQAATAALGIYKRLSNVDRH